MNKVATRIGEEVRNALPPTIFFFIALHIVAIIHTLMLKGAGIPASTTLQVTVAALILGKAVVLADMIPLVNRYPDKPLAYNVAWKTVIYLLVATLIHYLEHLIGFWRQTGNLVEANHRFFTEIIWPHFWAIEMILFILIVMYNTMHELVRVLGRDTVVKIFFGPVRPTPDRVLGAAGP